jgi:hypothetical protein
MLNFVCSFFFCVVVDLNQAMKDPLYEPAETQADVLDSLIKVTDTSAYIYIYLYCIHVCMHDGLYACGYNSCFCSPSSCAMYCYSFQTMCVSAKMCLCVMV